MHSESQHAVRYGRNYRIILAIVLPCLGIAPFIWIAQYIKLPEEWQEYVLIYAFLGLLITIVFWLIKNVYPKATLIIGDNYFSVNFVKKGLFKHRDFSVNLDDVIRFNTGDMAGDDYIRFKTKNPNRTFQLTARTHSEEHNNEFQTAMWKLSDKLESEN